MRFQDTSIKLSVISIRYYSILKAKFIYISLTIAKPASKADVRELALSCARLRS